MIAKAGESRVVQEFFQLFKTPWEFYGPDRHYDMVVATTEELPKKLNAKTVVIFNSGKTEQDDAMGLVSRRSSKSESLVWDGVEFPLYGEVRFFEGAPRPFILRKGSHETVGTEINGECKTVRIGYDLFQETYILLTKGQPAENARLPTLEIHISLLRAIMLSASIVFVEVPPVPAGYDFMACLTHDVDFTGISQHKFDRTFWGFLYRASMGSLINVFERRIAWSACLKNWKAALTLPLVFLGLTDDFWLEFDRYTQIEKGRGSTFYFIPFQNDPGLSPAPNRRAVKYDLLELKDTIRKLIDEGCEVGLHGIDAWRDSEKGAEELRRISETTGEAPAGVRMHWLYFSEDSPGTLEEIGCRYDSTFGYNDAVGFRAGTSQVFCPLSARKLLELPLTIQDTALFYPGRMHLSEDEAMDSCKQLIQFVSLFGGVLTLNWHTRSLSPERQWGDFYLRLLSQISDRGVWFATAWQITEWFRRRRELSFSSMEFDQRQVQSEPQKQTPDKGPSFILRTYRPGKPSPDAIVAASGSVYSDRTWSGDRKTKITA